MKFCDPKKKKYIYYFNEMNYFSPFDLKSVHTFYEVIET